MNGPARKVIDWKPGPRKIGRGGRVQCEVKLTLECGHLVEFTTLPSTKTVKLHRPESWPCCLCPDSPELRVVS